MEHRTISGVSIRAISTALPEHVVTQDVFESEFGEKEAKRIAKGTGIHAIREARTLKTSDLILAACQEMAKNDIELTDVDGIVVTSQTPDRWSPGMSFNIQHALGLSTHCLAIDVAAGCSGYITVLAQAASLISSGACRKVLVCTGDVTTKLIDENDRHLRMLFGDAASVTLLEAGDDTFEFSFGADGKDGEVLGSAIHYDDANARNGCNTIQPLFMDGTAVMNFALSKVPAMIHSLLAYTGLTKETLDLLVLHQANEFMLSYLSRMIGVAADKLPIDVDGIGNTSSTSIPMLLSRHQVVGTPQAKAAILCGFGAGLSWGAVKVNLEKTRAIAPVSVSSTFMSASA